MNRRTIRRALPGALAAAVIAAGAGLGQLQSGPAPSTHGPAPRSQAVRDLAVDRPIPPGGEGGSGVAPPELGTAQNGDQVIKYTDANGNRYSFQISAKEISGNQTEFNVWEKLQDALARAGQFSNGSDNGGTGYEYVPVLRGQTPTPDLLRLEWDNGQLVSATRVDIASPEALTDNASIFNVLNKKQGVQADEVVVDLEGRDKDNIMNVVDNIGQSFKSDNEVDLQKLDGVRVISDAQTYAPPTVDVTIVRAAGTTAGPVPLGLGGVTITGDAAATNPQAAVVDAAAAQLPPEELPPYETPEG